MMKKQMKRTVYEAPVTERFSVELEGSLMAASVANRPQESAVTSTGHEINEINLADEAYQEWNTGTKWE